MNNLKRKEKALGLLKNGQQQRAATLYKKVIDNDSRDVEAWMMLGIIQGMINKMELAEVSLRKAVSLQPNIPEAHFNLGNALKAQGKLNEAASSFKRAISLQPKFGAFNNLGNTYQALGEYGLAIANYRKAIAIKPDDASVYYNLAMALRANNELQQAKIAYKQAIELRSDFASAYNNLGLVYMDQRQIEKAQHCYRKALELDPQLMYAHSSLLHSMNYQENDPATVFAEYQQWDRQHGQLAQVGHHCTPDPVRRLRIAYVSADFKQHSVSYFFEPLIAQHDRRAVEVVCYSDVERPDDMTQHLRELADSWCDIVNLSDQAVAERISADQIDILVDLSGHSGRHRLGVFARRPAPVQVTWLGYPNTTGLAAMDYRFTDAFADQPGLSDELHTETLIRLPHGFLCFQPLREAPDVGALPVLETGNITFGMFNHICKINDEMIAVWSEILQSVPGSKMIIKHEVLGDSDMRTAMYRVFAENGIGEERLELLQKIRSTVEHLELYNRIDIALDTFPYNGTTTTCEALWMGAPVVSLVGDTHVSRVGGSILSTLGLDELSAETKAQYVQIAVELAEDRVALAKIREGLRARMSGSYLCNRQEFTASIEAAYKEIWQTWCNNP